MITRSETPAEARPWITDEIRGLLAAIKPPHLEKKRRTILLMAFARANQVPVLEVFSRPDTCAMAIWYEKWARDPAIKAAFDACYARALEYADEETANLEAHYRRQRRQAIGLFAAQAPAALAAVMDATDQRGSDRINAALSLIKLADPDARDVATPPSSNADGPTQTVTVETASRLDELLMQILYQETDDDTTAERSEPE